PPGDLGLRRRLGYLPENPSFYDHLSAAEFLEFVAQLFGLSRSEGRARAGALLERAGLADAGELPIRKFSKGMVQRLGIAQSLMNDPELIFLDEPMSGLDPVGRREVRNLILELRAAGKTIFFSTHILSDAESLCDRVAILDRGRLLGCGELHQVLAMEAPGVELVLEDPPAQLLDELQAHARACVRAGNQVRLEFSGEQDPHRLLGKALACGAHVVSFNPVKASLEDYFMAQLRAAAPPAHPATAPAESVYDSSDRHNRPAHI
ncbi:MAG: ATP-binding cassette domain-containing protein, partial [Terriglobia bacterium]